MADSEVELKLRVDPEDLPRLRALPLLAPSEGRPKAQTLESVYYDTADLRLRRDAVTLRVRRKGRTWLQTVKLASDHAGGAFNRSEWEMPVQGPAPDFGALDGSAAREKLGAVAPDELKPVFSSHIKRSVRLLRRGPVNGEGGALIEVAIDNGEIRTPDGAALPVSEIELELKDGHPVALYDLALSLVEAAPLHVEIRSKAERGYALAAGEATAPVKAARLILTPESTGEQAIEEILRNCLGHLAANEPSALAGDDPEGIHQMRVALRRLRSALGMFRDLLPADAVARLTGDLKRLAGALGPARDLDVFLAELVAPVEAAFPGSPDLAGLRAAALDARADAYDRARAAIRDRHYPTLLLRLGILLEERPWRRAPSQGVKADEATAEEVRAEEVRAVLDGPATDLAAAVLARRHKKARKRGAGFASLSPQDRHTLRIALKKLRYAAEFFRSLYPQKDAQRYIRHLADLQDVLGHLNDVATAQRLIGSLAEARARHAEPGGQDAGGQDVGGHGDWRIGGGIVIGWHARGLEVLEPALRDQWKHFAATKPFWRHGPISSQ